MPLALRMKHSIYGLLLLLVGCGASPDDETTAGDEAVVKVAVARACIRDISAAGVVGRLDSSAAVAVNATLDPVDAQLVSAVSDSATALGASCTSDERCGLGLWCQSGSCQACDPASWDRARCGPKLPARARGGSAVLEALRWPNTVADFDAPALCSWPYAPSLPASPVKQAYFFYDLLTAGSASALAQGTLIALDDDGDGVTSRDELGAGVDPRDPTSTPASPGHSARLRLTEMNAANPGVGTPLPEPAMREVLAGVRRRAELAAATGLNVAPKLAPLSCKGVDATCSASGECCSGSCETVETAGPTGPTTARLCKGPDPTSENVRALSTTFTRPSATTFRVAFDWDHPTKMSGRATLDGSYDAASGLITVTSGNTTLSFARSTDTSYQDGQTMQVRVASGTFSGSATLASGAWLLAATSGGKLYNFQVRRSVISPERTLVEIAHHEVSYGVSGDRRDLTVSVRTLGLARDLIRQNASAAPGELLSAQGTKVLRGVSDAGAWAWSVDGALKLANEALRLDADNDVTDAPSELLTTTLLRHRDETQASLARRFPASWAASGPELEGSFATRVRAEQPGSSARSDLSFSGTLGGGARSFAGAGTVVSQDGRATGTISVSPTGQISVAFIAPTGPFGTAYLPIQLLSVGLAPTDRVALEPHRMFGTGLYEATMTESAMRHVLGFSKAQSLAPLPLAAAALGSSNFPRALEQRGYSASPAVSGAPMGPPSSSDSLSVAPDADRFLSSDGSTRTCTANSYPSCSEGTCTYSPSPGITVSYFTFCDSAFRPPYGPPAPTPYRYRRQVSLHLTTNESATHNGLTTDTRTRRDGSLITEVYLRAPANVAASCVPSGVHGLGGHFKTNIDITSDGHAAKTLYDGTLVTEHRHGTTNIKRASHVEPITNSCGLVSSSRWVYDQADRDIDLKHTVDLQFGGLCSGSGQNVETNVSSQQLQPPSVPDGPVGAVQVVKHALIGTTRSWDKSCKISDDFGGFLNTRSSGHSEEDSLVENSEWKGANSTSSSRGLTEGRAKGSVDPNLEWRELTITDNDTSFLGRSNCTRDCASSSKVERKQVSRNYVVALDGADYEAWRSSCGSVPYANRSTLTGDPVICDATGGTLEDCRHVQHAAYACRMYHGGCSRSVSGEGAIAGGHPGETCGQTCAGSSGSCDAWPTCVPGNPAGSGLSASLTICHKNTGIGGAVGWVRAVCPTAGWDSSTGWSFGLVGGNVFLAVPDVGSFWNWRKNATFDYTVAVDATNKLVTRTYTASYKLITLMSQDTCGYLDNPAECQRTVYAGVGLHNSALEATCGVQVTNCGSEQGLENCPGGGSVGDSICAEPRCRVSWGQIYNWGFGVQLYGPEHTLSGWMGVFY